MTKRRTLHKYDALFESDDINGRYHSPRRPTTIRVPLDLRGENNLIGTVCGRMKCIGYHGNISPKSTSIMKPKKRGLWVVQCRCGKYETRTSKALKNPKNTSDRCQLCWHVKRLKRPKIFVPKLPEVE